MVEYFYLYYCICFVVFIATTRGRTCVVAVIAVAVTVVAGALALALPLVYCTAKRNCCNSATLQRQELGLLQADNRVCFRGFACCRHCLPAEATVRSANKMKAVAALVAILAWLAAELL